MSRLIRVFPRKTKATPDDALAYFGPPDSRAEADEVHVSVTFTYDKPWAEHLAEQWRHVAPVKLGGVAYGDRGEEFVPGKYIKPGYVFTSRGCPRRCWFCSVWKRDPVPRLLPIIDGWNVLDDNLLACPREHVEAVFAMLRRQQRRIEFTGGLEALSLQDYQVDLLASLRPRPTMFFAYDPQDEFETLQRAARRLIEAGFNPASHNCLRVYVLIGYPKDTFAEAEGRLPAMMGIGFTPMAMLWRPETPSQMKYTPSERDGAEEGADEATGYSAVTAGSRRRSCSRMLGTVPFGPAAACWSSGGARTSTRCSRRRFTVSGSRCVVRASRSMSAGATSRASALTSVIDPLAVRGLLVST
jgi:hypothetical protein